MKALLIVLAVIGLLAIIPLGVRLRYDESGFFCWVLAGAWKLRLYPGKKKPQKVEEKPEEKPKPEKKPAASQPQTAKKGGSWKRFLPLVQVGLDFLGDLRRKIRVSHMELNLMMAGDDPCDLAVNYGRANAAMGALLAGLNRAFVIKKQKINLGCDFEAEEMTIFARLDVTITLGRALALLVRYGVRGVRTYLNITNPTKT